jgi:protein phosphatase
MSAKALVGSATDTGRVREENQDSVSFFRTSDDVWTLLIVCDGMGGHAGGAQASSMAAENIGREFTDRVAQAAPMDALRESVRAANRKIVEFAEQNTEFRGMGTTCVVLAVARNQAYVAHVGDSRVYRVRPGVVEQVTTDHSYVQRMIDSGILTPEQAEAHPDANMLLRCLGGKSDVEVDVIGPEPVLAGDRYLLCSDGLWGQVTAPEIAAMSTAFPAQDAVNRLINLANERGGPDNISVQIFSQSDAHLPTGTFSPEKFAVKKFNENSQANDTSHNEASSSKSPAKSKVKLLALISIALLVLAAVALFFYKKFPEIHPSTDKPAVVQPEATPTKKPDDTAPAVATEKADEKNDKNADEPAVEKNHAPAEPTKESDGETPPPKSKSSTAKEKK